VVGSSISAATTTITYSTGAANLGSLKNVTAANVAGTKQNSTYVPYVTGQATWTGSSSWSSFVLAVSGNQAANKNGMKAGDAVTYLAGWKLYPNSTATTPLISGQS
jgi:hypothetical protein